MKEVPEYTADDIIIRNRWDEIHRDYNPGEIDETIPSIVTLFQEHNVKKVLDLGCGRGRHTAYLAQNGFDVYGVDIAGEGVKRAAQLLKEEKMQANFCVGSTRDLPYKDSSFEGIVSVRVIHHGRIEAIRKTIREMERVLNHGFIFITVRKRASPKERRPYRDIAPRTYIPTEGREKDIVHYFFTKELLRKEFKSFKIHDIWVEKGYYCLLGEKV